MAARAALRRGRRRATRNAAARQVDYLGLDNPFPPAPAFSDDRIEAIHHAALRVLEELGMKILSSEARELFRSAGARCGEDEMVFVGRDIVEAALSSAPRVVELRAGARRRDATLALGKLAFQPGAGAPHATDRERGRRPGSLRDFAELVELTHHFDALHMMPPLVEPQDVPTHLRHYAMTEAMLSRTDKFPFVFSRGKPQVMDCFEMIRDFRGLSDDEFESECRCYTIVNTNSPRQIDVPMARGLIDFARHGQLTIVTPFTLMGAMAPITVAGALTLSHAEALAAIVLTQIARPGAPVTYGAFASNVHMKSGAPVFGTPEHVKATLGAGQLARYVGLPWRGSAGSAANVNDAQAAHETEISGWGSLMAGATVIIHAAGWLEGGLTVSYEKFVADMDMVQTFAELCAPAKAGEDEIGFDALAEVPPGGHFFGAAHTLARYADEFYEPVSWDRSNFGTWKENGSIDTDARCTGIWKRILEEFRPPPAARDEARLGRLRDFISRRTAEGGAPPES